MRAVFVFCIAFINLINAATQLPETLAQDIRLSMQVGIINPLHPHLVFASKEEGQRWLSEMSFRLKKWVADEFLRQHYLTIIQYEAKRAGFDPQLILSIITVESKFNKYAISQAGALGMMQIMPFWPSEIGLSGQDLFVVQTNLRYGCAILRYYLLKEHGNLSRALARYNGNVSQSAYPKLIFDTYQRYWQYSLN